MLPEEEILERLKYCYLVFCQLASLQRNEAADPFDYEEILKGSSLRLQEDEFITTTLRDGLIQGIEDGGLSNLVSMYEGFVHAYCEVLETGPEDIERMIPREYLEEIIREVNPRAKP
ncbi:MAG TPA: hypothetical protein PKY58_12935 [Syntrophales bacterium]|nr:hypothetical protein [Syntrophales bacterium]HPX12041.1 hypothetical protein [Syntrophales bacterium]HQB30695.1 hypothetical protein [Syntrophales bacterium]HQN79189.1 hypothetical protein [Syntrophales bacterium]HQQ28423.1 hypothetical protein [Syntrophales bacterium]